MLKKILFLFTCVVLMTNKAWLQSKPSRQMNIIFILSDDHRYDAMGFMNKIPALKTPGMDRMAREGMHLMNAFVSTALCSPSRASILTGQYAHKHSVVDNDAPLPKDLTFFPQYLQKNGYQTAFLGKWHMGNTGDEPQPGFDYWLSFHGQGVYYNPTFNINGKRIKQPEGSYTTDLLTSYALDWMNGRNKNKPFFVYLSHKGVHAEFQPARRHEGMYKDIPVISPPSMYLTATDSSRYYGTPTVPQTKVNYSGIPQWVRQQRYSWHGVDHMYHGEIAFDDFYRRYLETLMGIDESIQEVLEWVQENGLENNTIVMYMGDNGFSFGEHGLIDKRHAYEESMRVPMLIWAPGMIKNNSSTGKVVMNVDIAPTFLEIAGIKKPDQMQGFSFLDLLKNNSNQWPRQKVFYEYYWESAFPQTPTTFAVRDERFKYIYYNGIWDTNELFDLQKDPYEMNNLIKDTAYRAKGIQLKRDLFNWLNETGGLQIPLKPTINNRIDHKYRGAY